ncbi:MAG: hypothetical protein A3F18_03575 [Legionellales bacterium RIFCSPHIGHO2_12_FULL_37_14]|nr:MAG: hypothetical protein A3F18_03575 [Legionellales bacterium RIFCSPHIGHO2_12_FULL_37_14]
MQNIDPNTPKLDQYTKDLPQNEEDLFNLCSFLVFDENYAIELVGSKEKFVELLALMLEKNVVAADVAKIKSAYAAKDWNRVQELAHKIKGGALYIGAFKMKMACQYLERYWKVGKRDLLEKLYQQMLAVIAETLKAASLRLHNGE